MEDHVCSHNYPGPERRVEDRRENCPLHSGHEMAILDMKEKQRTVCHNLEVVKLEVDTKMPQKLFYVTAGGIVLLVISILAFQWTIFERVTAVGLTHATAMGEVRIQVEKISSAFENSRYVNKLEIKQIENSVRKHIENAEKDYGEIKNSIQDIEKHMKNGNQK